MLRRPAKVLAFVTVAVLATACSSGSSKPSGSGGGSSAPTTGKTINVGIYTDLTGLAASGQTDFAEGVKAGLAIATKQTGYRFKTVTVDTQTSPQGALTAAQKLVQQDHVDAIVVSSALLFAGASFLTKAGVPVVGFAEDGPEWLTSPNMFSITGPLDTSKVTDVSGKIFKAQGVTTVGSIGYGISPSSSEAAKAAGVSAESVGLKAGYINAKVPFGSTNMQPLALAMKKAGVDGVAPNVDPNTSFALISALRDLNADPKVALLPGVGYGSDILQAGPGTLKAAQNVYFTLQYQPVEMNTPATKAFQKALSDVGYTKAPGLPVYSGYVSALLLGQGLKAVQGDVTQSSLTQALNTVTSFDAGGLYGDHPVSPPERKDLSKGALCTYVVKLVGDKFELVQGLDPMCGQVLAGKTVTPG